MTVTLTQLRTNLYKIVDKIIETGVPVEIERKGIKLKIVPEKKKSKLANLKPHKGTLIGNPKDFIHMNWYEEWNKEEH